MAEFLKFHAGRGHDFGASRAHPKKGDETAKWCRGVARFWKLKIRLGLRNPAMTQKIHKRIYKYLRKKMHQTAHTESHKKTRQKLHTTYTNNYTEITQALHKHSTQITQKYINAVQGQFTAGSDNA